MKRVLSIVIAVLIVCAAAVPAFALNPSEGIAWKKKLTTGSMGPGKIHYWISSGCEYTTSIPAAASAMTASNNPVQLSYTSVNSYSKMDFYQIREKNEPTAYTWKYRVNPSGSPPHLKMNSSECDTYDWVYGTITINDYIMDGYTNAKRKIVIMHEMGHVYGCKDLTLPGTGSVGNQDSLMFWRDDRTATGVTSDVNTVLNSKYK